VRGLGRNLAPALGPAAWNRQQRTSSRFAARTLAFTTQPVAVVAGATLTAVVVEARRADGQRATSFAGSVTLTKASGTGTLAGTVTVSAVAGVATFSTLRVQGSGADGSHTLAASATGLTGATSDAFSVSSVIAAADDAVSAMIAVAGLSDSTPTPGGILTIDGTYFGPFDYRKVTGNQNVTSFSASDWFTSDPDRCAIVVVDGDLTIGSAQTFTPAVRKLAALLYVTGTLTVTGALSMTKRGGNHSASGASGAITGGNLKILAGTYSGVTDPVVAGTGGAGGAAQTARAAGNAGTSGVATTGCGGGGSGGNGTTAGTASGAGATGSWAGGGAGGGGLVHASQAGNNAVAAGGAGGAGKTSLNTTIAAGGGAGNPGGAGQNATDGDPTGAAGEDGTGGVLVARVGTLAGAGTITAAGGVGGTISSGTNNGSGGGSGGGHVTVIYDTDSSSITPTALGGAGGAANRAGGAGGAGTARKLSAGYVPVDIYGADFADAGFPGDDHLKSGTGAPFSHAGSWHAALWYIVDTAVNFRALVDRSTQTTGAARSYTLYMHNGSLKLDLFDGTNNALVTVAAAFSAAALGLVDFGYDADEDEAFIRVNGGTRVTGTPSGTPGGTATAPVFFGATYANDILDGKIGPYVQAIDGTLLADADITALYASGVPRAFADLSSALRAKLDQAACFDMQETSGNRVSVDANTTLTATGTVGRALVYDAP